MLPGYLGRKAARQLLTLCQIFKESREKGKSQRNDLRRRVKNPDRNRTGTRKVSQLVVLMDPPTVQNHDWALQAKSQNGKLALRVLTFGQKGDTLERFSKWT